MSGTLDFDHLVATGQRRIITLEQYTRREARKVAQFDIKKGLDCDPGRHGARPHSAWATWYRQGYEASQNLKT